MSFPLSSIYHGEMRELVAGLAVPRQATRSPWWLWPNLVAADAPLVALLWQLLIARTLHAHVYFAQSACLALICWLVYALDYLFDGLTAAPGHSLPPRHQFFRSHRTAALSAVVIAGLLFLFMSVLLEPATMRRGAFLGLLVLMYLALTHMGPSRYRVRWPRELGVAVIFAAGTSVTAWDAGLLCLAPAGIFALLCWINMAAIEVWESSPSPSRSAAWLVRHLNWVAGGTALAAIAVTPHLFAVAAVFSCMALSVLQRRAQTLSRNLLRASADFALCTPALILLLSALV